MAVKKPAGKTGTAVANWDEELAKRALLASGTEDSVATGSFFQTRGGILTFNGAPIPDNTMNGIIIDHILENDFYEGRFDADSPQSPSCYAFGRNDDDMKPHEDSRDPQSETCATCPNNEWASADTGRGKACKNSRRLAIIPEDSLDDIENAPVAFLKLPVTSVKGWAAYVKKLAAAGLPPFAVMTEISLVADTKTQFKIVFKKAPDDIDRKYIPALVAKQDTTKDLLAFPYPEAPAEPARGAVNRKVAGAKAGVKRPAGRR